MPITTKPTTLRDVTLTLTPSGGTEVAYECQLTQAQLTPSSGGGGGNTLVTFCATHDDGGAGTLASWTLDLAGFQAYADAEDFSLLSFDSEGELFGFSLIPTGGAPSATTPGFEGEVTMVATPIGGTAGQYATFTVSLPCTGKPTKNITPPDPGL